MPPLVDEIWGLSGPFAHHQWSEVDLSDYILGPGPINIALRGATSAGISLASREGGPPPELVITMVDQLPIGTFVFHSVADAYVNHTNPDTNYGRSTALRTDASPDIRSYLRFRPRGMGGELVSATLRIYANSSSNLGYTLHQISNNEWSEIDLTYNNAPSFGPIINTSGPLSGGVWTEIDVTNYVIGNSNVNFGLATDSQTAISYASREGDHSPELIITTESSSNPITHLQDR